MATLEQILDQVKELPADEFRRLCAAIAGMSAEHTSFANNHSLERAWMATHKDDYAGQWVALDGDRLLAHGPDAVLVYKAAQAQGVAAPYLNQIGGPEAQIGGWQ